jgi:hypothetical protein
VKTHWLEVEFIDAGGVECVTMLPRAREIVVQVNETGGIVVL